jgi:hypothetical protein
MNILYLKQKKEGENTGGFNLGDFHHPHIQYRARQHLSIKPANVGAYSAECSRLSGIT